MLKVGIFTPYVRNEVTLAATQFADWLIRCGIDVVMLSSSKIESGIHRIWDHKVRRATNKTAIYSWAYGATHLCWFEADMAALKQSQLVAIGNSKISTQNYYFPYWARQTDACRHFTACADRVICLNRDLFHWLCRLDPGKVRDLNKVTTYVNLMSPGRLILAKDGKVTEGQTRLLAVLPKATKRDLGIGVLGVFKSLLQRHPSLAMTVLIESSLPCNYRTQLAKMRQQYGERLSVVTGLPYYGYSDLARQHDWVYVANTRHLFGSLLSTLNASSVPLVCHDLPPVGAHVGDKHNGVLIPCNLLGEEMPVADVDLSVVFKYLDCVVSEPEISLMALQLTGAEYLKQRQAYFEQFIYKEFVQ